LTIFGIGTDIVEIKRMKKALQSKKFLEKCFSPAEIEYCGAKGAASFAGHFAAKESVAKALGTGFRGFLPRDIEICHNALGLPFAKLSGKINLSAESMIKISISHEKNYATAMAIIVS